MTFAEFFYSEENKRPSRQRQIHLPNSIASKPAMPTRDRGIELAPARWKPEKVKLDGGIGIVPSFIPRPQTVFGNKRPLDK